MRLTKKDIDRATKRRKYSDGRGLFLSVSKTGSKTWAFCYRFPSANAPKGYKEREMGLGSIDFLTVDEARDRAVELRRLVRQGVDPMAERDRDTRAVVRQKRDGATFKQVAERFIDMKKAEWDEGGRSEHGWARRNARNPRTERTRRGDADRGVDRQRHGERTREVPQRGDERGAHEANRLEASSRCDPSTRGSRRCGRRTIVDRGAR